MSRVLVVDDNDGVRRVLASLLRRLGHAVDAVRSPARALQLATTASFDLLVSDYDMPGMDGLSLAARLRAVLGDDCPPVLFVSGSPIESVVASVIPEVRARFVAKPFDVTHLADQVEALLA